MPLRRSTRLRAFDYLGCYRYSVTICTDHRAAAFVRTEPATFVLSHLLRTSEQNGFAVIAYCVMEDHLHLLVEGTTGGADFRAFMRAFKQQSAFHWKRVYGTVLWERSYFEHVLRDEEDTIAVARYIVGNPVRAGRVEDPRDYPFSGSPILGIDALLDSIRRA